MSRTTRLLAIAILSSFALSAAACSDPAAPRNDCTDVPGQPCISQSIQNSGI